MSEISIYDIVPTPKLADKLIGTSVGGTIPDVTYNFTLEELLQLFIPNIPANTLQGVLDYGNTATQDINLTGTINTTDLNVLATANILDSVLTGETHIEGELFDRLDSKGTAGQVLTSTGSGVEWYTIPTVIPTLQQVLQSGNTSNISIVLTANITAVTATASNVVSNTSLSVNGTLKDGTASAGGTDQILSSTGSGVQWVDMPVYNAVSPLLYNSATKTFSIQVANSSQSGYLSSSDWINFDGKQDAIILTTAGTSGAATFIGNTLNIPVYTPDLSGYVPVSRTLTINGITYDLSANRSWTIPAGVADVTATSPLFSSGGAYPDISIQVASASQDGYLSSVDWATFNNKQNALDGGTGLVKSTAGAITYITDNSTNWNTAYDNMIVSAAVTGTSTKTLTLTEQDGGTITASWTDLDTGLTSVGVSMPSAFTVTNSPLTSNGTIAITGAGTNLQYIDGTGALQTLNTTVVPEGTNLYYLDSRARAAISLTTTGSSGAATYNNTTGVFNIPNYTDALSGYVPTSRLISINGTQYDLSADRSWSVGTVTSVAALTLGTSGTDLSSSVATGTTTPVITLNVPTASSANRGALSAADWVTFNTKVSDVTASTPLASSGGATPNITIQQSSGSQSGYLSSTDWTTFNNKQVAGDYITSLTGEATGTGPGATAVTLNNASVTGKVLTGVNITGGTVLATDTMLTAFGKLQNQINGLIGSTIYQGVWNANTNTPTLASGTGTRGYYYIVNVAGTTNLDGITDWQIGDWAIYDGTAWQKVDNTDAVTSVNGFTGAVSLTTDNIAQGTTNLYFANSLARTAVSLTTTGSSGVATYNNTTGVFNIPNYGTALANYLPLTGGTLTGALVINPADTGVIGLDVASNTTRLRSDSTNPFARQLTTTMNSGTLVKMQAAGYGGTYVTDLGFYTSSSSAINTTPNLYLTGGDNRVGINTDTPAATLDVVGTAKVSGQLTLGSTITNGTYTYTLPGSTGTLALTSDIPSVTGYVPYTGATSNLNMGTSYGINTGQYLLFTKNGAAGVGNSAYLGFINAASTDGVYAQLNTSNDIGFYGMTSSVQTSQVAYISRAGNFGGNAFIKSGGTSSQFLKADGSVDSNTYLTTSSASSTYLPLAGGALTGTVTSNSFIITSSQFAVKKNSSGTSAAFYGLQNSAGTNRWNISIDNAETGSGNTGFDFNIYRYDDAGSTLSSALSIKRSTGNVTLSGALNGTSATFSGLLSANGGDFRMTSGGTAAIGVVLSSEYNVVSNPKSVYTSYGQSTVLGGHEFRSVNGSGTGSITSAYSNPSGSWTFYYDTAITGKLTITSSSMGAQVNGGTFTQGTASSYALGIANGGGFDLTLGTSSANAIIQSWSSKPLALNPQGNNVGIGTISPSSKLQVEIPSESPATGAIALIVKTSNGINDIFRWYDGSTQLGVFKNSGFVGIGTPSPADILHVQKSSTTNVDSYFDNPNTTAGNSFRIVFRTTDSGGSTALNAGGIRSVFNSRGTSTVDNDIIISTRGTDNIIVAKNNGLVGIGTGTPSDLLTLYRNASADNKLSIYQGTNGYASAINLIGADNAGAGYNSISSSTNGGTVHWLIGGGAVANTMVFYTNNNTERMRITSGGNVGIGTTGNSSRTLEVAQPSGYSAGIRIIGNTGGDAKIQFLASGASSQPDIGPTTASPNDLIFGAGGSERMRITSTGNLVLGGTINSGDKYRFYLKSETSDSSSYAITAYNSSGNGLFYLRSDGLFYMQGIYNNTNSNAANVWVNSDGSMYRSTSSLKYKKNVQNYSKGLTELMQMRPVIYEGKCAIDEGKIFAGLIAEEIHDLGLTEFVQYAEDGTPDALAYSNMVSLLIKGIQELKSELDILKNK